MEFPRLVYRLGGPWALEAGSFSVQEVADEAALASAQIEGWHLDQYAALDAQREAEAKAKADQDAADDSSTDDSAKATREELEAKAKELCIPFGPKVSDRKLSALIAAATNAG